MTHAQGRQLLKSIDSLRTRVERFMIATNATTSRPANAGGTRGARGADGLDATSVGQALPAAALEPACGGDDELDVALQEGAEPRTEALGVITPRVGATVRGIEDEAVSDRHHVAFRVELRPFARPPDTEDALVVIEVVRSVRLQPA
jgi:hypothetical protein